MSSPVARDVRIDGALLRDLLGVLVDGGRQAARLRVRPGRCSRRPDALTS